MKLYATFNHPATGSLDSSRSVPLPTSRLFQRPLPAAATSSSAMEIIGLLGAAATVVTAVKKIVGPSQSEPLYTLTPPVFDRQVTTNALTLTPLETFVEPRRRLFSRHFTGSHGENLLDARIHMAPPLIPGQSAPRNDFMARVYLPQWGRLANNPGGAVARPLAEARFHVQHPECAHSFTEFVVKTEGGGAAFATGALNLTSALARMNGANKPAAYSWTAEPAAGDSAAATSSEQSAAARMRARSAVTGPRGLSTFFNLPLFGRGKAAASQPPAQVEGLSMAPGAALGSSAAFKSRQVLRDSPTLGLRFDHNDNSGAHVSSYSCGLHLDPQSTLLNLRDGGLAGAGRALQLGGWVAQQSDSFRFAAEGTVAPMQRYGDPAGAAPANSNNSVAAGGARVGPASMVPLSLAARMPLLVESRFGAFYHDARSLTSRATQPAYEVGFTVVNRVDDGGVHGAPLRGVQEFVASYAHHLTVRRNIHNPLEKAHNRSIHNYIDLAMEVVYRNEIGNGNGAGSAAEAQAAPAAALIPPSIRLGASWQLNKNSMIKARVQDDSVGLLYAIKSWWDPSASAAISVNHAFAGRRTTFGLSLDLENVGEVLFSRPDPSYKRMVASQRERIENMVELDENY